MKYLLPLLFLTGLRQAAAAQGGGYGDSPFSFSLLGGGTFTFFSVKSTATAHSGLDAAGSAGISLDYKVNPAFTISPAIILAGKAGSVTDAYDAYDGGENNEYELLYIEESVRFTGHIYTGDKANIFFGAGPYYGNAIYGKLNYYSADSQHIKFGSNGDFKSYDYGLTFLGGFEGENGFSYGVNFDLGLPNIRQMNANNYNNEQFRTRSFYLSIGKSF